MKNSEWGAVAYLAQSKYGRNGKEISQNMKNLNDYSKKVYATTGYGVSATDSYNTEGGQKASTTGNIYGIYDMSGGAYELTAGYVSNGNSNLTSNGKSLLEETGTTSGKNNTATLTKHVSVYYSNGDSQKYNYSYSNDKKGEAIWETSKSGESITSWFGDYSNFPYSAWTFMSRGGYYKNGTTIAGLFNFEYKNGSANSDVGFRAVCVPL